MLTVTVAASKTYDVVIAPGLLRDAKALLGPILAGRTAAVVTDDAVDALYASALEAQLSELGCPYVKFVFPHGEASKTLSTYAALLNFLAENRLTRTDVLLALGGGVTGDLTGFAAATYLRGIRFVQLPTTLLAAVDASVGGKTAVDLDAGKNLAGAFCQPDLVLCDWTALDTLPDLYRRDGMAEVIKYGAICDLPLLESLAEGRAPDAEALIARCIAIKRDIVEQDERDAGVRRLLNFGHTVGHAIELCSRYAVPHGFAVAAGMAVVTRAAAAQGLCPAACSELLEAALIREDLPVRTEYTAEALLAAMLSDKKRRGGVLDLIVPTAPGVCEVRPVPVDELPAFLTAGLEGER